LSGNEEGRESEMHAPLDDPSLIAPQGSIRLNFDIAKTLRFLLQ
jgi:hypothetical protein